MVPGHSKFEHDYLFAQIENLFYGTDFLNTTEILHVIGVCGAVPYKIPYIRFADEDHSYRKSMQAS